MLADNNDSMLYVKRILSSKLHTSVILTTNVFFSPWPRHRAEHDQELQEALKELQDKYQMKKQEALDKLVSV